MSRCGETVLSVVVPLRLPLGAEIGVLTSVNGFAARPARGFGDGYDG